MDIKPMVSVSLITYNQVRYIRRAIESILAQKINFEYEIIVGDDFSSDGTREILLEYQQKFPAIIKPILHSQRNNGIPGKLNYISTIYAATGKYIALLDGDDYWDDPSKLQKQVSFLEQNPEYVISFHDSVVVDGEGNLLKKSKLGVQRQRNLTGEEVINGALIPANTALFRNRLFRSFPDEFYSVLNGDTFTFALLAQHGNAYYHADIVPSGYTMHNTGVWSQSNLEFRHNETLHTYEMLLNVIDIKYKSIVKKHLFIKKIKTVKFQNTKIKKLKTYFSSFKYFFFDKNIINVAIYSAYSMLRGR
ncbi:glycosyltransferase [Pontibacter sp. JH31]|uniref:Glycosyltransferase n=1 Tax=Pontibacter aquaedesilientis TaxID=2766980 RepID=A0ABR7XF77_9BACT|nr:glycosyltransferase [Pontibacter aquaedesilientis]MBD1396950.1 glycosyltransferase [Pontibacter aquaedesilientis]